MKAFRTVLELMAICCLLAAGAVQFLQVDFNLAERERQEDLRLRDYVISHDLEYVKNELISLQKENWNSHKENSRRAWVFLGLVTGALVFFAFARWLSWRIGIRNRRKV